MPASLSSSLFPLHIASLSVEWLAENESIIVRFKGRATNAHLMTLFDTLDDVVEHWDNHKPFLMLIDTRTNSKPDWTVPIQERSSLLVHRAMERGLLVRAAIVITDTLIGQIVQLFFSTAKPFITRQKLKVLAFTQDDKAIAWLNQTTP
jgi:hypothetical protein